MWKIYFPLKYGICTSVLWIWNAKKFVKQSQVQWSLLATLFKFTENLKSGLVSLLKLKIVWKHIHSRLLRESRIQARMFWHYTHWLIDVLMFFLAEETNPQIDYTFMSQFRSLIINSERSVINHEQKKERYNGRNQGHFEPRTLCKAHSLRILNALSTISSSLLVPSSSSPLLKWCHCPILWVLWRDILKISSATFYIFKSNDNSSCVHFNCTSFRRVCKYFKWVSNYYIESVFI